MTRKQCIFLVCASMTEAVPIIRSSKSSTATSRVYGLDSVENHEGSGNICSGEHTWTLHTIFALFYEFFLQIILTSTVHINKGAQLEAFIPWLGNGLFLKRGNLLWLEGCIILVFTSIFVFIYALYICMYLWILNWVFYSFQKMFSIYETSASHKIQSTFII